VDIWSKLGVIAVMLGRDATPADRIRSMHPLAVRSVLFGKDHAISNPGSALGLFHQLGLSSLQSGVRPLAWDLLA
jgi:hypothetical protein